MRSATEYDKLIVSVIEAAREVRIAQKRYYKSWPRVQSELIESKTREAELDRLLKELDADPVAAQTGGDA